MEPDQWVWKMIFLHWPRIVWVSLGFVVLGGVPIEIGAS